MVAVAATVTPVGTVTALIVTAFVAATRAALAMTALVAAAFIAATLTVAALTVAAFVAPSTFFAAAFIAAAFIAAAFIAAAFMAIVAAALAVFARRFVLMEAGTSVGAGSNTASPSERATGAEREEPDREKCRQTLLHERSFSRELCLVVTMAALATMLGPVPMASFTAVAIAFAAFATCAFSAVTALAATATFATAAFTGFAAVSFAFSDMFFFGFFTGAFIGNAGAFAVSAWRRFGFFTGAFVGNAGAFAVHARRFVLIEAGAAGRFVPGAARQRQRAASSEDEEPDCQQRGDTLPHEALSASRRGRSSGRAHRAQLHPVERERVKPGPAVAKRVGEPLEFIREAVIVIV